MQAPDNKPMVEDLWVDARLAAMTGDRPYGAINDGALAVAGGRIVWVGEKSALPPELAAGAQRVHQAGGRWITPGLIDCHTHLVYGGHRAREFELRLQGATYAEIARQGGGINSTVTATRAADEDSLYHQAAPRLEALMSEGVTTLEIKSGYGLDLETELRMLRAAVRLGRDYPVTVCPTFLGAHALPPNTRTVATITLILYVKRPYRKWRGKIWPRPWTLFARPSPFPRPKPKKVFQAAIRHGLKVKLHAEQLSDLGGARPGRQVRRPVHRSFGISFSGRGPGPGRFANHGRAPAGSVLFPAGNPETSGGNTEEAGRAHGCFHGLQSRQLSGHFNFIDA